MHAGAAEQATRVSAYRRIGVSAYRRIGVSACRREVAKAFSLGLAVIPFRIEEVTPNRSLSYFLETVHWLDAFGSPAEHYFNTSSLFISTPIKVDDESCLQCHSTPDKAPVGMIKLYGSTDDWEGSDAPYFDDTPLFFGDALVTASTAATALIKPKPSP